MRALPALAFREGRGLMKPAAAIGTRCHRPEPFLHYRDARTARHHDEHISTLSRTAEPSLESAELAVRMTEREANS